MRGKLFLFIYLLLLVVYSLSAQDKVSEQVILSRTESPVDFDGIPDEALWSAVEPFKMIMHSPSFGKEPSEITDVRMVYDSRYLYVGARLYYKDVKNIRSASFKRDYSGLGGDLFGFILDTYNDNENGVVFFTTPDGLRFDASVTRDAMPPRPDQLPLNLSWNAFWDVKTKRDNEGWTVEFRIPLSSLRFQEINGEVRMGLIIRRWIPSNNEIDVFPAIPPEWGEYSTMKPSVAGDIVLRNVTPARPVQIAPYAMTGYARNNNLNNEKTEYQNREKKTLEAGADLKFGLSSNMILDLTLNTDFAQVESDDEKINLTRMALYYPEKRLFFLERASIFDFNSGGTNNLFYSRRIGLSDGSAEPIRIYGGAKLTGRVDKWEMGILDMQTGPLYSSSNNNRELINPSENFGVARIRKQVINGNSYIGAIMTSRIGTDGSYNIAYGLDGIFRIRQNDYLTLMWSQTFEDSVSNSSALDPARFYALLEHRSKVGLGYDFGYSQSGIHYNPGVGFESIQDVINIRSSVSYGWMPGDKSPVYSHGPEFRLRYNRYIVDGSLMTMNPTFGWNLVTKNRWTADLSLVFNDENLKERMVIIRNKISVDPGRYRFVNLKASVVTPQSKSFFSSFETEAGRYFNGNRFSIRAEPTWNVSRHFEFGGAYNFDYLDFSSRNITVFNHIYGIRALYMFSTRLSANAFIQQNSADHKIVSNIRIRYNPSEGNDLYVMFDEGRNTALDRETPTLPVYSRRAFMVKYTYTFNL
ncbi:MAG TPA: DUF5916 domain-containing protein [Bacteroidales bacterium]|nr:DUF5916 domain-containing protein [Bacteroidales bacterium]